MSDQPIPAPTPPQKPGGQAPQPPKTGGVVPQQSTKPAPTPAAVPTPPKMPQPVTITPLPKDPKPATEPVKPTPTAPTPAAPVAPKTPTPLPTPTAAPAKPAPAPQPPQPRVAQPAVAPKPVSPAPLTPQGVPGAKPLPMGPPPTSIPSTAAPTTLPPKPASSLPPVPPPPTQPAPPVAPPAEYKKSPFRFLPLILIGAVIFGLIFFIVSRLFGNRQDPTPVGPGDEIPNEQVTGDQTTITYWGLWEPDTVMQEVIQDFEASHPNIRVNYEMKSHRDYRERLQTEIASGAGPDVFRFHASWVPMLQNELNPMPNSVMTMEEYASTFYPVVQDQLVVGGRAVGIPLMYDGLALYYNKEALRVAGAQPPQTWAELQSLASQLTIRSGGKIQRAGMAIGNAENVEHFSDILGLLILQNQADPANPTSQAAADALTFYTNFVSKAQVWDETLPSSTIAFARGDVAMMMAPSWRAHEVKALNPNLEFGIASVPQLVTARVAWATYWAEGVSEQSNHKAEAWEFLQYLSSPDVQRKFHSAGGQVRPFGEIYARTDLANELASDEVLTPFLSDAPVAKNWYLNSYTHDGGLNDELIKYYKDAVNAVLNGEDPNTAMETVAQGTNLILRQYGLSSSTQ